jgi:hypothetical protein
LILLLRYFFKLKVSTHPSSYQIRRITRTIIQFHKINQHPASWQLLRHSGLSEERLTDEALKFLNQIKRINHG